MKNTFIAAVGFCFCMSLTGCAAKPDVTFTEPPTVSDSSSSSNKTSSNQSSQVPSSVPEPKSVRIQVPFSSQAPFANWDSVHEETCEEMALIMVEKYWKKEVLTPEVAESELQKLLAWEEAHGYGVDVTMQQLAQISKDYYGLKADFTADVTEQNMKNILATGQPIILPAAGRLLGNPYFSGAGPWYHALVAVGYNGDTMITNDPGTKRGEGYSYAASVLINAIHNWMGVKEQIATGEKVMLLVHL